MQRLLIANRGEIARRVLSSCRRLGIETVAIVSDPDRESLVAREADVVVHLGGSTPAESYLRVDAILDAARRTNADAVHPGYGFLAESADFARAVLDAGLTWVGPSPEAISAMGSKIHARARMEAAGVPVLPGALLEDGRDVQEAAADVGFPLLVKASAGGGGKGMRMVAAAGELVGAVAAAQREAGSAFGDATVFLERFVPNARHVEVQILGDQHGRVVAYGERDCSIQRRHQKIIEEAPSPAVTPELRERLCQAAVTAGEAIGYVGAGTVEFLLIPTTSARPAEFFFLEVNTRLQVEHPVTEMVTGLDLVELQLAVAEGAHAPDCPPITGWAIEARLYAEDPAQNFLPVTGHLTRFEISGARVDTGVESGSHISPFYDPLIAKVIASGPTRAAAARSLSTALARARVQGLITNRDFLVRVLRHPEFLSGDADTAFLERHELSRLSAALVEPEEEPLALLAAALAQQAGRRSRAQTLRTLPSGWRNNPVSPQRSRYVVGEHEKLVEYAFERDGITLATPAGTTAVAVSPRAVRLLRDGVERAYEITIGSSGAVHVSTACGELALQEVPRFPTLQTPAAVGSLISPMPGTVLRVAAKVGASVEVGQVLLVLEAMKMEQEIVAPVDGVLSELSVVAGEHVDGGSLLAVIEELGSDGQPS